MDTVNAHSGVNKLLKGRLSFLLPATILSLNISPIHLSTSGSSPPPPYNLSGMVLSIIQAVELEEHMHGCGGMAFNSLTQHFIER